MSDEHNYFSVEDRICLRCVSVDVLILCHPSRACQVGPGLVFLLFNHSYLGRGLLVHCVTPMEPLLQCVTHTMFYQSNIPPVVPKFILRSESIQVTALTRFFFQFFSGSHTRRRVNRVEKQTRLMQKTTKLQYSTSSFSKCLF